MNLVTVFLLGFPHPGAALPTTAARALPTVVAPTPASRFAGDVLAAHDAGWRLRNIEVHDNGKGIRIALTLSSRVEAWEYTLHYKTYDSRPTAYTSRSVKLPSNERIYSNETEIMDGLEKNPPGKLQEECGTYVVDVGDEWLAIDETAYHTVPRRARHGQAGRFVANELADAIDDDLDLVDVTEEPGENGESIISIEFDGSESRTIVVHVGAKNRLFQAEVVVSPSGRSWRHYRRPKMLRRQLRAGVEIHRLSLEPAATSGGEARLVGTMRGGRRFVVDLGDFEDGEYECPC